MDKTIEEIRSRYFQGVISYYKVAPEGMRLPRKQLRQINKEFDEATTALIDSAKREVLEQIRPPQATIDSMKLTQPHKYRGVEYPCCSICGFCPEAINAFIDSQLEQSEESE